MKKVIHISLLCMLLLVATMIPAFAKGPADKIIIFGPGLSEPIEITDAQILEKFSPWGDQFFDKAQGILPEPPTVDRTYQVLFYLKDEGGELQASYVFEYVPGNPGYIHLPGKGDKGYEMNKSIILRGEDGKWLYASNAWYDLMQPLLAKYEISDTGNSLRSDKGVIAADPSRNPEKILSSMARIVDAARTWPIMWLGIGIAIVLAGVLLRALSHSRK